MKIKIDSRKIEKGDIFVAIKGVTGDGHDYIIDAIEKGASLIVAEHGEYSIPTKIVPDTRAYLLNYLKENIYPQIEDLKLIGVTGTNGKTTTCYLLYEILNLLDQKCGYIGTIGFYIENKIMDLNNTTPDILDLYTMLLDCKKQGCSYVTLEVSSHALALGRLDTLLFDYAIFTNLTRDHLDFHKTMENYAVAKQKLFHKLRRTGKAIINIDDSYHTYFLKDDNQTITYGFLNGDYKIIDYAITNIENRFTFAHNHQSYSFESKLIGKHNIYNMLATIIVLMEEGFTDLQDFVKNIEAPIGRMDKIEYKDNTIIIDYAHTPDAVENIIKSMREIAEGHIYTLIGCGGNRDKTKRPIMGQIATELSDYVIFTSDNPRWEDPSAILEDITKDLQAQNYTCIVNRKEAIKKGVQLLTKNDILLLLGKGHENYQIINGKKSYFDDKQIVLEYM